MPFRIFAPLSEWKLCLCQICLGLEWMVMFKIEWSLFDAMSSPGCVRRMREMNGSRKKGKRIRNMQREQRILLMASQQVGCPLEWTLSRSSGPDHCLAKGEIEASPLEQVSFWNSLFERMFPRSSELGLCPGVNFVHIVTLF